MAAKRYGFAIDTRRCIGCSTCVVGCKLENYVPDGTFWNRVLTDGGAREDTPAGNYPNLSMVQFTVNCQHCENPACVKVCPVGATYKDPETGVVRQDYDKCIGCRMCMAACPYTGVRSFNWEEPSYSVEVRYGGQDVPTHQKHVVEKCTMCWHRLARGENPACVDICLPVLGSGAILDDRIGSVEARPRPRVHAAASRKGHQALGLLPRLAEGRIIMSENVQAASAAGAQVARSGEGRDVAAGRGAGNAGRGFWRAGGCGLREACQPRRPRPDRRHRGGRGAHGCGDRALGDAADRRHGADRHAQPRLVGRLHHHVHVLRGPFRRWPHHIVGAEGVRHEGLRRHQ